MKKWFGLWLASLMLAGCVTAVSPAEGSPNTAGGVTSNGERIYFTAASDRGTPITYTGGPAFGGMMGSNLACASCHGADGRGGETMIHMQVINAPDIRWKTLSEHVIEELKNPAAVYDLAMFKTAVEQGRHPDGDELDTVMPRWSMSDADLADLAQFLKTLP